MPRKFAEGTEVPVSKSKFEIEDLLPSKLNLEATPTDLSVLAELIDLVQQMRAAA